MNINLYKRLDKYRLFPVDFPSKCKHSGQTKLMFDQSKAKSLKEEELKISLQKDLRFFKVRGFVIL